MFKNETCYERFESIVANLANIYLAILVASLACIWQFLWPVQHISGLMASQHISGNFCGQFSIHVYLAILVALQRPFNLRFLGKLYFRLKTTKQQHHCMTRDAAFTLHQLLLLVGCELSAGVVYSHTACDSSKSTVDGLLYTKMKKILELFDFDYTSVKVFAWFCLIQCGVLYQGDRMGEG